MVYMIESCRLSIRKNENGFSFKKRLSVLTKSFEKDERWNTERSV